MKSIRTKIVGAFTILLLIVCISFGVSSYRTAANAMSQEIGAQLSKLAGLSADLMEESLIVQWNSLEAFAENDSVKNWKLSWESVSRLMDAELKRSGSKDFAIADLDGNTMSPTGKTSNVKDREYFQKAVNGERSVSDPIINKLDGSVIIVYAVPVKTAGKITGVLFSVRDGNVLSETTDKITFAKTGKAFMINSKGTTIANAVKENVIKMDNIFENYKKDPGLKGLVEVEKKMTSGETGYGEYAYKGVTKFAGYAPVKNTGWSIAISAPRTEVLERLNSLKISVLIMGTIILLISIVLGLLFGNILAKPIVLLSNHLKVIATGDFTQETPASTLKLKDEIGTLAKSVEAMQLSIKGIIHSVLEESNNVSELSIVEEKSMEELSHQVEDVSATTEELSAGLEETAASTQEMNATSSEIERAIDSIADKAQEGSATANEISKRAKELKETAIESQKTAHEVYRTTEIALKSAIEQSKSVNEINVLSDAILQITSQTNLLALNAAIEAARAGAAGKGFAVVADEIRKLAEDSKNTVSEIQKITQVVLTSVQNLSGSSMKVLDFIDTQVLKDYETLVKTGEQYNNDAIVVDGIVTDLSATSEELAASIQSMMRAINEITIASSEGAEGTAQIAERTMVVTQKAKEVLDCTRMTKECVTKLVANASKIKV